MMKHSTASSARATNTASRPAATTPDLAEMAYERKKLPAGPGGFTGGTERFLGLAGKLFKSRQKQAQQIYRLCLAMERSAATKPAGAKQPVVKEKPPQRHPLLPVLLSPPRQRPKENRRQGKIRFSRPDQKPCLLSKSPSRPRPVHSSRPCRAHRRSDPLALELALKAYKLSFRNLLDQLLCLPTCTTCSRSGIRKNGAGRS